MTENEHEYLPRTKTESEVALLTAQVRQSTDNWSTLSKFSA